MNIIDHMADIVERYDHYIIDVWGVLHNGERAHQDAIGLVQKLPDLSKQVVLLSNSPMRADHVANQLESRYGLPRESYIDVVTSGEATHRYLRKQEKGFRVFYIGQDYFFSAIEDLAETGHIDIVQELHEADVILAATPGMTYSRVEDDLELLQRGVDLGVKMICANPDLIVQVGDQLYPCAGTWAAKYQQLGGEVLYFGKPHALVYQDCMRIFNMPPKDKVLAIGDSLHTDIAGAHDFAIDSLFNITGIHTKELKCALSGSLDAEQLEIIMKDHKVKPNWVMEGVKW